MSAKPLLVGVTGGIGAGKSTVCEVFRILGVPVYDADQQAKELMVKDPVLVEKIKDLLGPESYTPDGLNRSYIAKKTFGNKEILKSLNSIVHPAVGYNFRDWVEETNAPILIKEAALLFESGSYKSLDKLITVSCPEPIRIRRVLERDPHRTKEDIISIIKSQWPEEKKIAQSDFVIYNDERQSVITQVLELHQRLGQHSG